MIDDASITFICSARGFPALPPRHLLTGVTYWRPQGACPPAARENLLPSGYD